VAVNSLKVGGWIPPEKVLSFINLLLL